jgi:hypothetical protein
MWEWKLAIGAKWWEISHMTTLVAADEKGRVPIRGSRPGQKYLVTRAGSEWRITEYVSKGGVKRNSREWSGSKQKSGKESIWSVLRSMGEDGLTIEPAADAKQTVPPCRF